MSDVRQRMFKPGVLGDKEEEEIMTENAERERLRRRQERFDNIVTVKPEDFEVQYDEGHRFSFFEDENGDGVYGYGHTDPGVFAQQVNGYDAYCSGRGIEPDDGYNEFDVIHGWAIAYVPEGNPEDEWMFSWADISESTPGSFPFTRVSR